MSEGRFLVASLPLLCALTAIGIDFGKKHLSHLGSLFAVVAALGVATAVVPNSLRHSRERRHHYPVSAQYVGARGRFYHDVAEQYAVKHPSALDGDLGGTSFYSGMPIVDLGMLGDATLSHWRQHPSILREYVHGERRPTFMRLSGFWFNHGLQDFPEFTERYIPSRTHHDISIDRRIFLEDALDTRTPVARFEGADLIRSEIGSDVRLWILVRKVTPRILLVGADASVRVDHRFLRSELWRPGEIVRLQVPRPRGSLRLCVGDTCAPLSEGQAGATIPQFSIRTDAVAHARARADFELELTLRKHLGLPTIELAQHLDARSRIALEAGDFQRAFRDAYLALQADPTLAHVRRRIEELRLAPRAVYDYRAESRLEQAIREFHLQPDERRFGVITTLARAADRPERAALAYLATRMTPEDSTDRLHLAECLVAIGALEDAASLLPIATDEEEIRIRAQQVARSIGRPDLAGPSDRRSISIAPGLELVASWAHLLPSGRVELSLALAHSKDAPNRLFVAGRAIPFDRPPVAWDPEEIFVHQVVLDLPGGRSPVSVGSITLTLEVEPFTHDFETGGTNGWRTNGGRFRAVHFGRGPYLGFEGDVLLDGNGQITSPRLTAGVDEVCALVGGAAELRVASTRITARPGRWLHDMCLDLHDQPAAELMVSEGRGGRVQLDDVGCFRQGRPTLCAGAVHIVP
jgi:hypothetical protein